METFERKHMKATNPLPVEDVARLRREAVPHFKSRYPQFAHLQLVLTEDDDLFVDCASTEEARLHIPIENVLYETAKYTIGINCVRFIFNSSVISTRKEVMVATAVTLEQPVIENGATFIPQPRAFVDGKPIPACTRLIPIEEMAVHGGVSEEEFNTAIDLQTQTYYKIQNPHLIRSLVEQFVSEANSKEGIKRKIIVEEVMRITRLFGLGTDVGITPEDRGAAIVWLYVWKAIKLSSEMLSTIDKIDESVWGRTEPEAIAVSTEDVTEEKPKRTRKPRQPKTEVAESTAAGEDSETSGRSPGFNSKKVVNNPELKKAVTAKTYSGRYRKIAEILLDSQQSRGEVFTQAVMSESPSWVKFINKVCSELQVPKDNLSKLQQQVTSELKALIETNENDGNVSRSED